MRSMTGYSKLNFENDEFKLTIEIKSVNNKNLNLKIRLPYLLNFLENRIKTEFSNRVFRGSVDLRIDFEDKRDQDSMFEYDERIAGAYMEVLDKIEDKFQGGFDNKLNVLIRQPNVIKKRETEIDEEIYSKVILDNLHKAIDSLISMKKAEGERLKEYFEECIAVIREKLTLILEHKDEVLEYHKGKMLERLNSIKSDVEFNEKDILKEVLMFTDRFDVSEETSRLESHLKQFLIELDNVKDSLGKKLDFILQEMFRELNTCGVKCNFYEISKLVVECKTEVEKIREQVMNIE
jgi:uncharacterized protein (TIGR00255 family)